MSRQQSDSVCVGLVLQPIGVAEFRSHGDAFNCTGIWCFEFAHVMRHMYVQVYNNSNTSLRVYVVDPCCGSYVAQLAVAIADALANTPSLLNLVLF